MYIFCVEYIKVTIITYTTLALIGFFPSKCWLLLDVCFLLFYILATCTVLSGWVPTCHSVHSRWLYSAASLGQQATSIITCYSTQSHYPDTELISPFPSPNNAERWARKQQVSTLKSLIWLDQGLNPPGPGIEPAKFRFPKLPAWEMDASLIRPVWSLLLELIG